MGMSGATRRQRAPWAGKQPLATLLPSDIDFSLAGKFGSLRPLLRESACPLMLTSVEWVPGDDGIW